MVNTITLISEWTNLKSQFYNWQKFMLQQAEKKYGYTGKVTYQKSDDKNYLTDNPNRRCPVIDKARKILGYNPQVSVEEGVNRYLEYLSIEGIK